MLWVTLGIILGGRTGYVLFYNLPHFAAHPLEIVQLWNGGMSFHGGFTGCVVAVVLFARKRGIPILSLGDITCAVGPIGLFLGRIANFINGELWGRPADVPWAMVFPGGGPLPRHPSQLYEAALEGLVLLAVLAVLMRAGRAEAAGPDHRQLRLRLRHRAHRSANSSASPTPSSASCGAARPWAAAVDAAVPRRPRLHRLCAEASAAAGRTMADIPPLEAEIRRRIAAAGADAGRRIHGAVPRPIREHGYYTTRDPLGARGDFITAPEISQMFGELIGLWMAAVWKQMGAPENVRIIELGPGRGTMMKDALRAAKVMPDFRDAVVIHLVEISPALEAQQQRTLEQLPMPMFWHRALDDVPEGPAIILANEFFDALPVHQAVKIEHGWHERRDRHRCRRQSRFHGRARSAAAFRQPAAGRRCAARRTASIFEWRDRHRRRSNSAGA